MGHWVDERLLAVCKTQDEGVPVRRDHGGVLPVDDSGGLVPVLVDDNAHSWIGQDGRPASHCRTGNIAERLLAGKELFNHDVINPLGSSSGDCHDTRLGLAAEGAVELLVLQTSRGAEDETFLELVELSLGGLQMLHHYHKGLVLLVQDPELLM